MILHNVYFSAKGTTKYCADYIVNAMKAESKSYDWLRAPQTEDVDIPAGDVLLFSMPIYGGYIPKHCAEMVKHLKGNGTPAMVCAVYGNRHYDNSILQMKDLLTAQGFKVIAAGAFLAEHSIFTTVAAGRPDLRDKAAMTEFAEKCSAMLQAGVEDLAPIEVPGNPEYDASAFKGVPMKPTAGPMCVNCGTCAAICPVKAIDPADAANTDPEKCISCGACIAACPLNTRNHYNEKYPAARESFETKYGAYKEPEMFYAAK